MAFDFEDDGPLAQIVQLERGRTLRSIGERRQHAFDNPLLPLLRESRQ